MREILFRGKRRSDGQWLGGDIAHNLGRVFVGNYFIDIAEVDPNTVGQYTGFFDGNGQKIFEGDIVSFTRVNALGYTNRRIGEVKYYDKLPIFYILATTGDAWDWVECNNITVIGNVHDNPDLLEGSTNGL